MSNVKYDRIMADNKHYKAEKVGGFWQFIQKFPPTGYVGKHRMQDWWDSTYVFSVPSVLVRTSRNI